MMRLPSVALFVMLVAATLMPDAVAIGADLPTVPLSINGKKITAEVAATPEQRASGLMNRFSLKPNSGMLFVFERPEPLAFWMKNTYVPLSIAFIGADGRILNIDDMAPHDEANHWSKGPGLYALEMRKGWFAEAGVKAGDRVEGLGSDGK
jgi:uncharacterized membrane protein (UPF0127 family)